MSSRANLSIPMRSPSRSRRRFLSRLCQAGLAAVVPGSVWSAFPAPQGAAAFEEIPPSASGIHWRHVAGLTPNMYMPESLGAGCAFFDYDNDGSVDMLISVNDEAPILLRNNTGRQNHWVGLRLVGRKANVDAVGAKITYRSGDFQRQHWLLGRGGFLSAHDPRVVLGLGPRTKVDWIEVKWPPPSNKLERFVNPPVDRYIKIVEGEGKWE